jgi:hypothetical protein
VPLLFALSSSGANVLAVVMAVGLLIAIAGHVINSRWLILTGILVIGVISVYFGVFVAKVQ